MSAMQAFQIYLCLVSFFPCCCPAQSADSYPTNNLIDVVAAWKQKTLKHDFQCVLAPEWIGEVGQKAFDDYGKAFITNQPVRRVRLDLAMVVSDWHGGTNLAIGMRWTGRSYTHETIFRESLPSVATISKAKNLSELRTMLGPSFNCDAGDCFWLLFTLEPTNRVRVLSVHAGSPMYWPTNTFGVHDIGEAIFRPANPNSQDELRTFKSGRELSKEDEAQKAARRSQFEMPLRTILEALEKPDDSELQAYRIALNNFRNEPSRELMEQFVESINEGTTQISGVLEDYLFDNRMKLNLTRWESENKKLALRDLVDALPRVKTSLGLTRMLWLILEAEGGGELIVQSDGKTLVDVGIELGSTSKSQRLTTSPNEDQLLRAAEACRDALKQKYPDLK